MIIFIVMFYYIMRKNNYIKYNKFNLPEGKIFNYLADKYFVIISGLIIRKDLLVKRIILTKIIISLVTMI